MIDVFVRSNKEVLIDAARHCQEKREATRLAKCDRSVEPAERRQLACSTSR